MAADVRRRRPRAPKLSRSGPRPCSVQIGRKAEEIVASSDASSCCCVWPRKIRAKNYKKLSETQER